MKLLSVSLTIHRDTKALTPLPDPDFYGTKMTTYSRAWLFISQVVLTFVQTQGFLDSEYKVVTNFPRRDVSAI